MWKRLNKREKILILTLFAIAFFIVYSLYLYNPLLDKIKNANILKDKQEEQLIKNLVIIKQLPELRVSYNSLKNIEEIQFEYDTLTPEDFFELIERISKKAGTRINTFIPEEKTDQIKLALTLSGSFINIIDFLVGLKSLARQIEVNLLAMKPESINLSLEIKLIYQKNKYHQFYGGDKY